MTCMVYCAAVDKTVHELAPLRNQTPNHYTLYITHMVAVPIDEQHHT